MAFMTQVKATVTLTRPGQGTVSLENGEPGIFIGTGEARLFAGHLHRILEQAGSGQKPTPRDEAEVRELLGVLRTEG